jgi:hypothetical protein
MPEPALQPNASWNAGRLRSVPTARQYGGECGSVRTRATAVAGRVSWAQTRAKAMKKSWSGVYSRPRSSTGCGSACFHAAYACARPESAMSSPLVS